MIALIVIRAATSKLYLNNIFRSLLQHHWQHPRATQPVQKWGSGFNRLYTVIQRSWLPPKYYYISWPYRYWLHTKSVLVFLFVHLGRASLRFSPGLALTSSSTGCRGCSSRSLLVELVCVSRRFETVTPFHLVAQVNVYDRAVFALQQFFLMHSNFFHSFRVHVSQLCGHRIERLWRSRHGIAVLRWRVWVHCLPDCRVATGVLLLCFCGLLCIYHLQLILFTVPRAQLWFLFLDIS